MRGGGGGLELLEKRPPNPRPQGPFALPTPRGIGIPCLIFTPRGIEQQLKIFCDVAAAPRLHHLVPPHLTIPCFHKPLKHNVAVPISAQKVRIRPGKGKGKSDGWFPQPLTHNTWRVCTEDPETKLPMHSLCPKREWEREWYGVTTPNIVSGRFFFLLGQHLPLLGRLRKWLWQSPCGPLIGIQMILW